MTARSKNFRSARISEKIEVRPHSGGRVIPLVTMPKHSIEARRFTRKAVAVPARLLLSGAEENDVSTVDISESGVGIIAAAALNAGSSCVVALDLHADNGRRRINAWGEIVYTKQVGPDRYRSGIRFTDMDSYSRLCIRKLHT
jgi:hypothetical protein